MSGGFGPHSHWANARVRALPSGLDDLLGVGMAFAQQRGQEEVFRLPIRFASRLSHRTTTECSITSSPGSSPGSHRRQAEAHRDRRVRHRGDFVARVTMGAPVLRTGMASLSGR